MAILTIDIGGTEIKSALYEKDATLIQDLPNLKTAKSASDNEILKQVCQLTEQYKSQITGVAIASAGVIDPFNGKVVSAGPTIPNYAQTDFKKTIEEKYQLPCSAENDVNAMALGELWQGAGKNVHSALCITLGTGLGGALLMNGQLWRGFNFSAGEIGFFPYQNKRLEEYASTTGLLQFYLEKTGENINGIELFNRLKNGDKNAEWALNQMINILVDGLLPAIYLFAPEALIVGGGIAKQSAFLEPLLIEQFKTKLYSEHFVPKIIRCAILGNRANMLGALKWHLDSLEK